MNWYKESQNKYDHIPKENKGGKCFDKAYDYIKNQVSDDLLLVHAIIKPLMGPLSGVEFGHAWVEQGDNVIDTSRNNEIMNKHDFYLLGGLMNQPTMEDFRNGKPKITFNEGNINRYTYNEARRLLFLYGNSGPWDEKFEDFVLKNDNEGEIKKEDEDDFDQYQ